MILLLAVLLIDTSPRGDPDWHALTLGSSWRYSGPEGEFTRTVVGYRKIGSRTVAEVVVRYSDGRQWTDRIFRDIQGYAAVRSGYKEEDLFLTARPKSGEKWKSGGLEYQDLGMESVEVGGRRMRCRKIAARADFGAASIETETWYAQGIGRVREASRITRNGRTALSQTWLVEFRRS